MVYNQDCVIHNRKHAHGFMVHGTLEYSLYFLTLFFRNFQDTSLQFSLLHILALHLLISLSICSPNVNIFLVFVISFSRLSLDKNINICCLCPFCNSNIQARPLHIDNRKSSLDLSML